jgi:hypothetical protein
MSIKGYKATDKDGKCRDQQFKVGETYAIDGDLRMCSNGFHFCEKMLDVYEYYPKNTETRVFEIEASGKIEKESTKSVTSKIKIVRELEVGEILDFVLKNTNSGYGNSGNRNSGNRNSGDWNSGYGNSGNWNSGDGNSGNRNSGNRNSGNRNSGDWNSGDGNSGYENSGYGNSGNRNSGDWNSGDGNSGYFNTTVPVYFFNKPSDIKWTQDLENKIRSLNVKPRLTWITSDSMTEEEKKTYSSHKTIGGFLRDSGTMSWDLLTKEDKDFILSLPNYDDVVFKRISGISLTQPKTVKVTVDGQEFEIDIEKARELGLAK